MSERRFPILGEHGLTVPWSVAELAYASYAKQYGTQQSLERIAERGGFGRDEFTELLGSDPLYQRIVDAEAALAAERERADRAEADVAALREAIKKIAQHYVGVDRDSLFGPSQIDPLEVISEALAAAHPGAPLLAALDQAREALENILVMEHGYLVDASAGMREVARAALAELAKLGVGSEEGTP